MRLTEKPEELADREKIEDLLGQTEDVSDVSRLDVFRRGFDAYVLAPARIAADDWRTKIGALILGMFAFMVTVWEPMFNRQYLNQHQRLIRPFDWEYTDQVFGITVWAHPLGTNEVGQDILARIVNASPDMAAFVLAGGFFASAVGVIIGVTAGYKGGRVDELLMGLTDVALTIPGLPLVILLAAVLEPRNPYVLGIILAIDNWPGLARSLRSQVLTIREESYVEASRAMGVPLSAILLTDIVPQLMPYTLISAANAGRGVIVEAVGLYFLGFLSEGAPNWGRMLNEAYSYGAVTRLDIFYLILWPMLILALVSFGLILTAQGLDHIFNPRLRARHSKHVGADASNDAERSDN